MPKVQPAEIGVQQFQSSTGIYPPLNSSTSTGPISALHFSELRFTQSTTNQFVPVVGLVDNLAPTVKIAADQQQEVRDQASQPGKKLSSQAYFRTKMDQLGTTVREIPSRMGAWSLFFDPKLFSMPSSGGDVLERFRGNLSVFYANYAIIGAILLAYCLLTSPLLLIGAAIYGLLAYSIVTRNQDVSLLGQTLTRNQQLIGITICFIPLFVLLGLSGVFFWLIGATTCVIVLHSLFHNAPQQLDPSGGEQSGLSGDVKPEMNHNGGTFQVVTL